MSKPSCAGQLPNVSSERGTGYEESLKKLLDGQLLASYNKNMSRNELAAALRTALDAAGFERIGVDMFDVDMFDDGVYLTARNTRDAYPKTAERTAALHAARSAVRATLIAAGVSKTIKHRGFLVWCMSSQHEMCSPITKGHRCGYRWPEGM